MDKARRHIADENEAVICEGQIDVIRCHQSGLKTAVAAQGTAFTDEHVQVLRRYADSICIVFDPDRAGKDAAIRAAGVFMEAGLAVRMAVLPDNEDPDLFIRKHGVEAFRGLVKNAVSAVGYQIGVLSAREDSTSEIGAMRIAKGVLQTVARSPNAVQRAKLIQEAAERLRLPASALHDDLRHMLWKSKSGTRSSAADSSTSQTGRTGKGSAQGASGPAQPRPREEVELCEHMVHILENPELFQLVQEHLPTSMLRDECCRTIVEASLDSARSGRAVQDVLRDHEDRSGELQTLAAQVLMAPAKVTSDEFSREDAVKDIILYVWRRNLESERAKIDGRGDLKPGGSDEERRRQLTYDLKALKHWGEGSTVIEIQLDENAGSGDGNR
jgi:DNA primase